MFILLFNINLLQVKHIYLQEILNYIGCVCEGVGCVCMGCACVRVEGVSSKINIWGDWSRSHVYLVGVALGGLLKMCVRCYGASVYSASVWDLVSVNVQYIFCFGFHTPFYTLLYYLLSFSHFFVSFIVTLNYFMGYVILIIHWHAEEQLCILNMCTVMKLTCSLYSYHYHYYKLTMWCFVKSHGILSCDTIWIDGLTDA